MGTSKQARLDHLNEMRRTLVFTQEDLNDCISIAQQAIFKVIRIKEKIDMEIKEIKPVIKPDTEEYPNGCCRTN